jgi:hypothetical protein
MTHEHFMNTEDLLSADPLLLDQIGLSRDYNCHSFRIGVATSAHAPRLEDQLI